MAEVQETRKKKLIDLWNKFSKAQKTSIIIVGSAFLVSSIMFIYFLTRTPMATLFTGMEPADANVVVEMLEEMNVPYELAASGTTIIVPEDRADQLRIRLHSDGALYGGGMGFELFDATQLGVTDFERNLNYQRALQVELQRTIGRLEEVIQARVHLTMPEPSVFIREATPPTASILLSLQPLAQLRRDQIQGIVFLVAGSVENLTAENVTIIDTMGNILTDGLEDLAPGEQMASNTLKQMQVRREFEKDLERRIQSMLERVLGPGRAVAMVTAELDFDLEESTIIAYGDNVPRSESSMEEAYDTTWDGVEGGVPGDQDMGFPNYMGGIPSQGESSYERSEDIINYEVDETRTNTIRAPGRIVNLSTAVAVDDGETPMTEAEVEAIQDLVRAALGIRQDADEPDFDELEFDEDGNPIAVDPGLMAVGGRMDQIEVMSMNFNRDHIDQAMAEWEALRRQQQQERYMIIGTIVGIILIFLIAYFVYRRRKAKRLAREREEELARLAAAEEELEEELEEEKPKPKPKDMPQKDALKLLEEDPETVIAVVKAWLSED